MLPHVQIRSAQVAFIGFDIQRRYNTGLLTFSADAQWSSWHDPELACFWAVSGDNWVDLLCFAGLVPLRVGTTCLGTLDPLNYWHFMLHVVRHKNVYNSCPLKYEAVYWVKCFIRRIRSSSNAGGRPVIRYNTIHYLLYCFHDLAEAGIPMLSFINSFKYQEQTIVYW